jgi:hypothetical protein
LENGADFFASPNPQKARYDINSSGRTLKAQGLTNQTMTNDNNSTRLETEAIVIGYAMSRLDASYLQALGFESWTLAFQHASALLQEPANSFKNLRDEFDPFHTNSRQGWHKRAVRQSRQRVLDELADVSDDALLELVRRILARDETATADAIDSLAVVTKRAANVAERLLTGRRAEEYFLPNSERILGIPQKEIIDYRNAACGFDFGRVAVPEIAIEIKGMKAAKGSIQFTDREWIEAGVRRDRYILVVVGRLATEPQAKVFEDPYSSLNVMCDYVQSLTASWSAGVSVD